MNKLLLGFDCRQPESQATVRGWDAARRSRYLLREDVTAISVDVVATSSVFAFDPKNARHAPIHLEPADFHQQALGLWCKDADTAKALRAAMPLSSTTEIAVTLHQDAYGNDQWWADFDEEVIEPSTLDDRWKSLGYDIANRYFTSALFNCGVDPGEKSRNAARWAQFLSGYGLFEDQEQAVAYRDYASARFKDHAPFFVFEISQWVGSR